ncbi:hypothetical protein AB0M66_05450 [Streptomyces albidoflavus]|uniref:hypothetical protein n=1 Tax=Streptomyces albidoflavus TaxID=1886 RepID=UPI00342A76FC
MGGLDRTRGVRLRRLAVAALALSGILGGCGLGEPKQTYEQAYEAMRPDAMAAMKEAWPGVEMEKDSGGTEECGGLDISADKDASKLSAHVTYRGISGRGTSAALRSWRERPGRD